MPPNTDSKVSFAKTTLPYPIFAADFDPYNRGYLVVGGGGGQGRSGVPNQISVLDISNRATIETVLDIELSRDEDSAVSLSNLATKEGLVVFAGINSSEKDQNANNNLHFRSFDVKYPPRKKQKTEKPSQNDKGSFNLLGKRSLFKPGSGTKRETYQRLLRLSPAQRRDTGQKRIGAVATGLAKESEIVVFNATVPTPDAADILTKIALPANTEANDLDIAEPETSEFSLAYCTDFDLYEQTFKYNFNRRGVEKLPNGPRRVWQMPSSADAKSKAKIRCLRFLNAQNALLLCNKPGQSGAELRIVHLYPTGPGSEMLHMDLPKHIKHAATMDVCALDSDADGNQQIIVAVAGQDVSIEVYTTNFKQHTDTFSAFHKYLTMKEVHDHQMTKVCFTPFHAPNVQTSTKKKVSTESPVPGKQFVALASTSYGNTVVVDHFPLTILDSEPRNSRYVLRADDEAWVKWAYLFIGSLIVLVFAFLIQSFRGGFSNDNTAGPFRLLPRHMREFLDKPASAAYQRHAMMSTITPSRESVPTRYPKKSRLRDLLHIHQPTSSVVGQDVLPDRAQAVVIRATPAAKTSVDGGLDIAVHPDKAEYLAGDPHAKHWHELQEHERARWRKRLVRAGQWAEAEGEKVLKGVLFSEYADLVGEVAQEVMREL